MSQYEYSYENNDCGANFPVFSSQYIKPSSEVYSDDDVYLFQNGPFLFVSKQRQIA